VGLDQRAGLPRYHGPAIEGAAAPHHAAREVRLGDAGRARLRPALAKRGQRDAPRMGEWLRAQGLVPDLVLASPARRAQETASKVCKVLGIEKQAIQWEPRIYDATRR